MSNQQVTYAGPGFGGLLFLLFLGLKLGGVIDWSWWWVTSPLWIPFAIFGTVLLVFGFVWLCAKSMNELFDRRHRK